MADAPDDNPVPVRFKRRKITQSKRTYSEQPDLSNSNTLPSPEVANPTHGYSPSKEVHDEEDSVPNLQEILRSRRRPRDRIKEVARKPESAHLELVPHDTPQPHSYTNRFVAQTGQVVDQDDKQMTTYVEARLAEQNYRQYGWPIPKHLQTTVAELAPDLKHTLTPADLKSETAVVPDATPSTQQSNRITAGMGQIEEVEITPVPERSDTKWKRLPNGGFEEIATGKVRLGKDGKPRRPLKRRNSDAVKRDQMVEALMSEAKLDFFDSEVPSNVHGTGAEDNDEAILERFRAEYYESIEDAKQQQRKPAQPLKGAKEAPKGPKLGGSKSARAKMRLQEEQAAKTKR